MTRVLVTGGAGYIGSHVVKLLSKKGIDVIVYDNFSTGNRDLRFSTKVIEGDILDFERLCSAFSDYKPDTIMHFAAKIVVPESVNFPLMYYNNNVVGTLNVLSAMKECNINNFIFSSTAAVYGNQNCPVVETMPLAPINPYGRSKAIVEEVLQDCSIAEGLKYIALRYFNVAGADPEGELGETKKDATHLITTCVRTAVGKRDKITIFGTDYPTPDGTCIRDYIHVMDLANAHLLALDYLLSGGESDVFNCGYGEGFSVLDIVNATKNVTGVNFKVEYAKRREGDSPKLIADVTKIKRVLGWKPKYDDIKFIIKTAWEWEKSINQSTDAKLFI